MQQWVGRKLLDEMGDPDEQYHVGEVVEFATPDGMGTYAGVVCAGGQCRQCAGLLIDFNHPWPGSR